MSCNPLTMSSFIFATFQMPFLYRFCIFCCCRFVLLFLDPARLLILIYENLSKNIFFKIDCNKYTPFQYFDKQFLCFNKLLFIKMFLPIKKVIKAHARFVGER